MKSPTKQYGGKGYLAEWIVSHFPSEYLGYFEPYFGGGSVLFRLDPEGHAESANDIDGRLMNFWQVVQNPRQFKEFKRLVTLSPVGPAAFRDAQARLTHPGASKAERAWAFFVLSRQSMAGGGTSPSPPVTSRLRRGVHDSISAYLSAVDGLPAVAERLQRVLLHKAPALSLFGTYDQPDWVWYVDCPYLHSTRTASNNYAFEMTQEDHTEMLTALKELQHAKVLLSGYRSPLYETALSGWNLHTRQIDNKSSKARTKPMKEECLWTNF